MTVAPNSIISQVILPAFVFSLLFCASAAAQDKVTFTSGKTLEAEAVRYNSGDITLRKQNGETATGSIEKIAVIEFNANTQVPAEDKVTFNSGKTYELTVVHYENGRIKLRKQNGRTEGGPIDRIDNIDFDTSTDNRRETKSQEKAGTLNNTTGQKYYGTGDICFRPSHIPCPRITPLYCPAEAGTTSNCPPEYLKVCSTAFRRSG